MLYLDLWEHICEICASRLQSNRILRYDLHCFVKIGTCKIIKYYTCNFQFVLFYQWSNSFICLCRWDFYSFYGLHEDDSTFCLIRMLARKVDYSCRFSSFAKVILVGIVLLDNLIRNVIRVFYYIEKTKSEMHTNICVRWSLITLHLL